MPQTLQTFLERAIDKSMTDLIGALDNLPADKRNWSPMGDARTALDMVAECALLNGATGEMIAAKAWTMGDDFGPFMAAKVELAKDETKARALLIENTKKAIAVIKTVPDSDLEIVIQMPWEPATIAQMSSYPYWNMCYHEGQINYIASMLGCLK